MTPREQAIGQLKQAESMNLLKKDCKEKLMYSLYRHCQTRSNTSKQVFDGVVKDLALFIASPKIVDECVEIIRPYKNSGTNLESTVDALCSALGEGRWT